MTDALRLFLIEDDDNVALLIRKHLERVGHHVARCRSACDALIVLSQTPFDLVLLDQRLPDTSGLELLTTLGREGISVPVLMVTAYGDEQLATRVLRAGALDYVVKDPALSFLGELPKRVSESVTRHRLEEKNRLLVQALESARDGVLITDLSGTILKVNRSLEEMTGYGRHELLGQTPRLFKSGAHGPELYESMWRAILGRQSWQGELTNRRKDGTPFQASMTISPIVDEQGRLTNFVGIQRDVTERRRLEAQLRQAQKMQSVGTLAGGVAHEFNNLLAGINGYAALGLREPDVSPTLREFLASIVELSERAAVLTRQLLAFARKPALVRQRTAMAELVRDTAALVRHTMQQEVAVELPEPEPAGGLFVDADANQLQQAVVNLALNARDAVHARPGPASAVAFRLRPLVLDRERPAFPQPVPAGDWVVLEVEDRGCGMTAEVLAQALDPFYTTKEVGQGTGLGLPLVFGIVQGHSGYLTIESARDRGTCVGLYLPRQPLSPTPPDQAPPGDATLRPSEVVDPDTQPARSILVIDDEEAVLDVIRRFLEIAGHRVSCATSGHEAGELLANSAAVDLILLDLMMPREDAATNFARLRQWRPGVPVLLSTGLPQADPAPALLCAGASGLLHKPFRMSELWDAVQQALSATPGGGSP
jgi:PAS domain S-box-containing protein